MKGFRDFILRGNIVELAVAVIIGVAFNDVVKSLTNDIINPIIGAVGGRPDLSTLAVKIGKANLRYGAFLTALINFLIIAAVVYFLVVLPIQHMLRRLRPPTDAATPQKECPECLSSIPVGASRCAFCTVAQEAAPA